MEEDYSEEWYYDLNHADVKETLENMSCDNCEKSFFSEKAYNEHMLEHKVCNLDGCTFSAHEKIIQKHVRMQHSTGLYDKIRNINTPEDISKWIEDRKKRYPSIAKINQNNQGNKTTRRENAIAKTKFTKYKSKRIKCGKQAKAKTEKFIANERENLIFPIAPFKGTSELYMEEVIEETHEYDDEEWTNSCSSSVVKLNSALQELIGAYMSEEEPESSGYNSRSHFKAQETCKDDVPIECAINRTPLVNGIEQNISARNVNSKPKKISNNPKCNKKKNKNFFTTHKNKTYNSFKKRAPVLLEKLLANQIKSERNILLQCVKYVTANNFLEKKNL